MDPSGIGGIPSPALLVNRLDSILVPSRESGDDDGDLTIFGRATVVGERGVLPAAIDDARLEDCAKWN